MSRKYSAQEMREMASVVLNDVKGNDYYGATYEFTSKFDECVIEEMLRQAADMMERDERCEKKWEYAERFARSGDIDYRHYDSKKDIEHERELSSVVVRREVGDWEEVSE